MSNPLVIGRIDYTFGYDFRTGDFWTERTANGRNTPYIAIFNLKSDGSIELESIDMRLLETIEVEKQLERAFSPLNTKYPLGELVEEDEVAAVVDSDKENPPCHKASLEDVARYADCGCFEITQNEKGDA